jgi:ABC-type sulfate/molybdate transport systems ATPase subunit
MDPRPDVLTARGLEVARDGRTLLRDVDLTLGRGEVAAILGPNGVGKSTLLSVLAGLLPAAHGTIEVQGRIAAALQAPAMARRSVLANVEAALGWWGVERAARRARAHAALERMNATHLATRRATELSGGEARRVHLARAIALQADVLLLDEPFAGLDPSARAELLSDAERVLRDPGRATLVVLHDRAEAWALADRLLVVLDDGIAADGPPRAILEQPPSLAVAAFLGFTGRIRERDGTLRVLRPAQVALDPEGEVAATIERCVPEEDGVLCDAAVDGGTVQVRAAYPGPRVGDRVRLRLDGGVRFDAAQAGATA